MDKRTKDIIALSFVEGAGPGTIVKLLRSFKDTEDIFHASCDCIRRIAGRPFRGTERISSIRGTENYIRELEYIERENIKVLCFGGEGYPESLSDLYDPPAVLFMKGEIRPEDSKGIAVVGSRRCSLYGLRMAQRLGADLAACGVTVISGMARGIDDAAHRGALNVEGGRTIAVMGSGFANIYPPGSVRIFNDIVLNGAVVTEYTSGTKPLRHNFPRRNRIISALSRGVVVVEAARKSGAMITVDMALDQGRDIFAVPGPADSNTSDGTNYLIKQGAKLVTRVEDIIEEFDIRHYDNNPVSGGDDIPLEHGNDPDRECEHIIAALDRSLPVHIDDILETSGIGCKDLSEKLLKLEISGKVKALAGRKYILI